MAANKRTDSQIESDRLYIADLFVKNLPVREIAAKVNERAANEGRNYEITFQQAFYDIKKILENWKDERTEFIDERINIELAKLDKVEQECWIGWEASKSGKLRTKIGGGVTLPDGTQSGGAILERTVETSVGDVRFLDRIQSCIEKRVELLGIQPPKKIELSGDVGGNNPAVNKRQEEVISEIRRLHKALNIEQVLQSDDATPEKP